MILKSQRLLPILLALAFALVASACSSEPESESSDGVSVVVTTTMLGDLAREVVGENGTVTVLLPIGASPHDYDVSSAEISAMYEADLVVANGLGLEESVIDVLEAAEADGVNVLIVGERLDPLTLTEREACDDDGHDEHGDDDDDEGEDDHGHGECDPHVWFDPDRDITTAVMIAEELAAVDASVDWGAAASEYAAALTDADEQIRGLLDSIPPEDRLLVTNHHSFGYFADRYGFEVVGTVIPGGSALSEPSSAELAALVRVIDETGVSAIFTETTEPAALVNAIAGEIDHDVEVIELYTGSLGEEGSGAETLIDMLLTNARRIVDGLS